MRFATTNDGSPIAYDVFGRRDGEPLVMLQGLGADSRGWTFQRLAFGRRFRCIAIDNRGVGRSAQAAAPTSLEQMSADVGAVLDDLGLDSAHVMGASMGGAIAQVLAVTEPERVRSLVLACTACRNHPWRRQLLQSWADAVGLRGMGVLASEGLPWLVGPRLQRLGPGIRVMARLMLQSKPASFIAQVHAILSTSDTARFDLAGVRVPTLVITGSHDQLTPWVDAEEIHRLIPESRLLEVRGVAHLLMMEAPDRYNRAVISFLEHEALGQAAA
jgi:3-oxoadipate enol-lactonase